jgi:hypothetical protein
MVSCAAWASADALASPDLVRDASLMLASVVCKDGAHWVWDIVESDEDGEHVLECPQGNDDVMTCRVSMSLRVLWACVTAAGVAGCGCPCFGIALRGFVLVGGFV